MFTDKMAVPADLQEVALGYFCDGFSYLEIIELLRVQHNCNVKLSVFKAWLKKHSIYKRPLQNRRDRNEIVQQAVLEELQGSGSIMGYRRMHKTLQNKGICCRREDVRLMMRALDPDGVDLRRRRRLRRRRYHSLGPNYVWHIDGHDKLKPFGFCIHGCIDGYSRKLIWLEVGSSNKMPEVIAKYYLEAVKEFGVPLKMKADNGTEHSLIEPIHTFLRFADGRENAFNSFSVTTSPQNQRIEAYWSILQRDRIGWWRKFFNDIVDLDLFSSDDPAQVDCIKFCFMNLIRQDLHSILSDWNTHIISRSRNGAATGRPDSLYYLPHLRGKLNYSAQVDNEEIEQFAHITNMPRDFSREFEQFAAIAVEEERLRPSTVAEAFDLYITLLDLIR